jgi:hypothetical protein
MTPEQAINVLRDRAAEIRRSPNLSETVHRAIECETIADLLAEIPGLREDLASETRAHLANIEEYEREVAVLQAQVADMDKDWFQIIESILRFHPVSKTEALKKGIVIVKRLRAQVEGLERENVEMREYCNDRDYGRTDAPFKPIERLKAQVEAAKECLESLRRLNDDGPTYQVVGRCYMAIQHYDAALAAPSPAKQPQTVEVVCPNCDGTKRIRCHDDQDGACMDEEIMNAEQDCCMCKGVDGKPSGHGTAKIWRNPCP